MKINSNILSLDLSEKRCGIALYKNKICVPLFTINTFPRFDFLNKISLLIEEHNIKNIVIGLNFRSDNTISERFNFIKHMAHSIKQKTNIEYSFVNEYNSTKLALQYKKNHDVDSFAAKIILDRYIKTVKQNI